MYLARHGERIAAVVGSANLTSGLVANVEVVAVLHGDNRAPQLQSMWELAESWWRHENAVDCSAVHLAAPDEVLGSEQQLITMAIPVGSEAPTLADRTRNWVGEITPDGVWVEPLARAHKAARRSSWGRG